MEIFQQFGIRIARYWEGEINGKSFTDGNVQTS